MQPRKLREFERLLVRSERLEDQELLKMNAAAIENVYAELRKEGAFERDTEKRYLARIKEIQNKIGPKITAAKPRPAPVVNSASTTEDELAKHAKYTDEILALSEQLKRNAGEIALQSADDQKVMDDVLKSVDGVATGSEKNRDQFQEVKNERLGWKVYYQLAVVVVIYMVVSFVFL